MKDDPVPNEHHVARLCRTGGLDHEQKRPLTAAFMPKKGEEYLSVNWVELFRLPSREDAIDHIRQCLNSKFELRPSYRLSLLNVGELIARVKGDAQGTVILKVVHRPDEPKPDPSHSGIFNLPHQDKEKMLTVANALVESVLDVVPAKTLAMGSDQA